MSEQDEISHLDIDPRNCVDVSPEEWTEIYAKMDNFEEYQDSDCSMDS